MKKLIVLLSILLLILYSTVNLNAITTVTGAGGLSTVISGSNVDLTNQSANIANTTLYTPTSNGVYRLSAYEIVTTPATTSSTLPQINFYWTDGNSGVAQITNSATNTGNTSTTATLNGGIDINVQSGTPIIFNTSGYASSGATSMVYAIHIRVEQVNE